MKTQKQIDEQIRLLKEARPKIVSQSAFGTDNLELLDAQNENLVDDFPMQKTGD